MGPYQPNVGLLSQATDELVDILSGEPPVARLAPLATWVEVGEERPRCIPRAASQRASASRVWGGKVIVSRPVRPLPRMAAYPR